MKKDAFLCASCAEKISLFMAVTRKTDNIGERRAICNECQNRRSGAMYTIETRKKVPAS